MADAPGAPSAPWARCPGPELAPARAGAAPEPPLSASLYGPQYKFGEVVFNGKWAHPVYNPITGQWLHNY